MPTQVGTWTESKKRKKGERKRETEEWVLLRLYVYFKLFLPHVSRLECMERVYFSHLISFDAITMAAAVAHIEIGLSDRGE